TWGAETNFTINPNNAPGETRFLRVENRPNTDEFAVVWADYQQNLSGNYYDFSANAFSGEPATVLQNNLSIIDATTEIKTKVFDIAFESLTGELMVCYGDDGGTELNCNTRSAGTAGTWSARFQYTAMVNETEEIDMASDPASDRIAIYTMSSTARDAEAAIWSGTVWGTRSTLDATTDTLEAGTINGSVQWLRSGTTSAAVVTYDDDNALGIDWATYTVGAAGWVLQPDYAPASGVFNAAALNDKFHITTRNPNNFTHVASLIVDGNNDLSVKRLTFNGTAFTWSPGDNGAASHNANMHTSGGWSAAIAYASYLIPAVLSVDIVNASGVSVASPSYALTNIASTNVCNNTSTGYLGSATQRIRVSNGTTTPGWSLSVAATGGTAAKWTATTMTFDYNDASNGGCNDGADTDTDPGQLSFGASASGTVTPAASCTDTGVIPTSTAGFSEGTVNSVTLYNGNASASVGCYWDITLISIYQRIPAYLLAGTYSLPLTLTIVAN
ncbi:MAG TPA: hypothetical protein VD735_03670, partial [Candidatus Saccharimonadales bacterium]|nr:hypothetical protein [Candidatus Saccharimonadales bacterium]